MIKTKDEIIQSITDIIGDNPSDSAIALVEDISDTLEVNDAQAVEDEWKRKYADLDLTWRNKYISRFNGDTKKDEVVNETKAYDDEEIGISDLFKKED